MRCVSCNRPMSEVEMSGMKPDNTPEDMCSTCRGIAFQWWDYDWTGDEEYLQDYLTTVLGEDQYKKYFLGVFNE